MKKRNLILLFFTGMAAACGGADLEVVGSYNNNFGMTETITSDTWGSGLIAEYDNDANEAFTQAPADAMFGPNTFSKLVWTEPAADGSFFYCTVDFGRDTLEDVKTSTQTANDAMPEASGCGGFSWTKLTPM